MLLGYGRRKLLVCRTELAAEVISMRIWASRFIFYWTRINDVFYT